MLQYIRTFWNDNMAPAIKALNLNKIESKMEEVVDETISNTSKIDAQQVQINNIVTESTDNSEVIAARTSIFKGETFGSLGLRLEDIEENADDITDDRLSDDPGNIKSNVYNSQLYDAERWSVNQKTIDDGQDESLWTAGIGAFSVDTANVKLGKQSLRLTENDNTAGALTVNKNNLSLDLTELESGESSDDSDYIFVPVYVSVASLVNFIIIGFSQDTVYSGANSKEVSVLGTSLVDGWNYLKILKSSATTSGSGSWSGIQSIQFRWNSLASASGAYVSFQLIQLVKKHPTLAQPEYFQEGGEVKAEASVIDWMIAKEFEKWVYIPLNPVGLVPDSLLFNDTFIDFTINQARVFNVTSDAYTTWWVDASNNIQALINPGGVVTLRINETGNPQKNITRTIPALSSEDLIVYNLTKKGENVSLSVSVNGKEYEPLTGITTLISSEGKMAIGSTSNTRRVLETSIGSPKFHADTCNSAGSANRLEVKEKNGAFTSDELSYGELGLDKSNDRLYMKYSNTQVIYFTGTVI